MLTPEEFDREQEDCDKRNEEYGRRLESSARGEPIPTYKETDSQLGPGPWAAGRR